MCDFDNEVKAVKGYGDSVKTSVGWLSSIIVFLVTFIMAASEVENGVYLFYIISAFVTVPYVFMLWVSLRTRKVVELARGYRKPETVKELIDSSRGGMLAVVALVGVLVSAVLSFTTSVDSKETVRQMQNELMELTKRVEEMQKRVLVLEKTD